ncbi:MAG: helix-turn-helix transcriptional regulator [Fretibacterium sp.]|nr:helix-turn-helix transcriptional regulator [Fretibacterium sp.]
MKGTIGYKRLMTLSMLSWAMGGALAGLSPGMGLFFIEGGCALFELAFWLLILRLSSGSPNPARLVCAGLALLTLALLSSHALLQAFAPLEPSGTFGFNARVALLIGLTATLSFFLPALRTKPTLIPPEVSRPPAPTPEAINTLPTPRSPEVPEVREMFLKSRLEALGLTRQECRVALMLLAEEKDTDICEALFISKNTLKFHIRNLNRKLGVANRLELPDLAERLLSDLSAPPQAVIERTGGA